MTTSTDHQATHSADHDPPRRPSPTRRVDPRNPAGATHLDDEAPAPSAPAGQDDGEGFSPLGWLTDALSRYWVPPKLWGQSAASLEDLSDYAHTGEWTRETGPLRALGIGWWRMVGLPVTAVCRRIEWVAQRPGRFFAVLLLAELVLHSSPGHIVLNWLAVPLRWLGWLLV